MSSEKRSNVGWVVLTLMFIGFFFWLTTYLLGVQPSNLRLFSKDDTAFGIFITIATMVGAVIGGYLLYIRTLAADQAAKLAEERRWLDSFETDANMLASSSTSTQFAGLTQLIRTAANKPGEYSYIVFRTIMEAMEDASRETLEELRRCRNEERIFDESSIHQTPLVLNALPMLSNLREPDTSKWPEVLSWSNEPRLLLIQSCVFGTVTWSIIDMSFTVFRECIFRNQVFQNSNFEGAFLDIYVSGHLEFTDCNLDTAVIRIRRCDGTLLTKTEVREMIRGGSQKSLVIQPKSGFYEQTRR